MNDRTNMGRYLCKREEDLVTFDDHVFTLYDCNGYFGATKLDI